MAANDWFGASPLRVERAEALPTKMLAADGRMLGWLAGMMAQDRHYHTVMATLTASENYPSAVVRAAAGLLRGRALLFRRAEPRTLPANGRSRAPGRCPRSRPSSSPR